MAERSSRAASSKRKPANDSTSRRDDCLRAFQLHDPAHLFPFDAGRSQRHSGGLRELERRGVSTIDCRRAQFSAEESTSRLRLICRSWKVMFHAEYSSGQPLRMLVDLRAAVDDALGGSQAAEDQRAFAASALIQLLKSTNKRPKRSIA